MRKSKVTEEKMFRIVREAILDMRDDRLRLSMKAFGEIVREHHAISSARGVI